MIIKDLISLLFPDTCIGCSRILQNGEKEICIFCVAKLPVLTEESGHFNLEKRFIGKTSINRSFAYLKYSKLGIVQKLLFALKYKGRKEVGLLAGRWFGKALEDWGYKNYFDIIIPVPLHKKRLKKRGYNQSDLLAQPMSECISALVVTDAMIRTVHKETQTRKKRIERWQETEGIYKVIKPDLIEGKNILIVDDVVTTGATLESIATVLLENKANSVSVAALAVAT